MGWRARALFLAAVVTSAVWCGVASAQAADRAWRAETSSLHYGLALQSQVRPAAAWGGGDAARGPLLHAAERARPVLVMGVSVPTGDHSSLAWQTPLAVGRIGRDGPAGANLAAPGELQLAWTLRRRDVTSQWLGGSPLRMSLSSQTVVTVKPRLSRVSVTLQHTW